MMRYAFRPLPAWTDPETKARRSGAVFRAKWNTTLKQLMYEAEQLGGDMVVVQVVVDEADLRQDGMLRTRAVVRHPGAVVSLDSKHGPLRFACDTYEQRYYDDAPSWQANVRAIVLGLEALRSVDRYGVTRRGEQYRGWTAIEAGPGGQMSADEAARLLAAAGGGTSEEVLTDPAARQRAWRAAARKHHPDVAGPDAAELFRRAKAAKDLLDKLGGDA